MAWNKLSPHKTTITPTDNGLAVIYQKTTIVQTDHAAKTITLDFGGWDSATTRRKMNQASRQFNLGFGVWREKGKTFIHKQPNDKICLNDLATDCVVLPL